MTQQPVERRGRGAREEEDADEEDGEEGERVDEERARDDAVLVVNKQVFRGKDGARQVFTQLLSDVPQAQWQLDTVFADDVLYLEWKATGGGRTVDNGVDTFVFADGLIRVQTVLYTAQPA